MKAMRLSGRRGGAAVEFGLTLPVILFILMAAIEYGWMYTNQLWLNNAVRDAARFGMTLEDNVQAQTEARLQSTLDELFGAGVATGMATSVSLAASGLDPAYSDLALSVDMPYRSFASLVPTPPQLHAEMTVLTAP